MLQFNQLRVSLRTLRGPRLFWLGSAAALQLTLPHALLLQASDLTATRPASYPKHAPDRLAHEATLPYRHYSGIANMRANSHGVAAIPAGRLAF